MVTVTSCEPTHRLVSSVVDICFSCIPSYSFELFCKFFLGSQEDILSVYLEDQILSSLSNIACSESFPFLLLLPHAKTPKCPSTFVCEPEISLSDFNRYWTAWLTCDDLQVFKRLAVEHSVNSVSSTPSPTTRLSLLTMTTEQTLRR